MRRSVLLVLLLAAQHCLFACGDDTANDGTTVRVATYNTGLARGYVDHAALRFDAQLERLEMVDDVDVLCLQEVWEPTDRSRYIEALSARFPHAFYENVTNADLFPNAEPIPPPCAVEPSDALAECARPLCESSPDLATCVLGNCGELFNALSPECQACAASNITLADIDDILETCLMETQVGYSYDGQNGLLLLSTSPIQNQRYVQLDAFLTGRGVLMGKTNGITVACTHFSAQLEPVYSGEHGSYQAENLAQIDATLALFADDGPQVFAGDFNTGPTQGTLSADWPNNYARIIEDGWTNPNVDSATPLCTWCQNNLISGASADEAIDHIFVRGAQTQRVWRFLDETLTVVNDAMEPIETSYSDHYGLGVELRL